MRNTKTKLFLDNTIGTFKFVYNLTVQDPI